MEVRDDAVYDLEVIARIDEDLGPAALACDLAFGSGRRFECPDACRTNSDDAVTGSSEMR